ncbi:MAG TPA: M28 family peptidase [Bdellovibrionota bacterium]|jgi:leucyl aminopeptidase|nr:M28 family peptidase [Bdellovibrionota bacterium]
MKTLRIVGLATTFFGATIAQSKPDAASPFLITGTPFLRGIAKSEIIFLDEDHKIAMLKASRDNESVISKNAHLAGRCGGYEKVSAKDTTPLTAIAELKRLRLRPQGACAPTAPAVWDTVRPLADQVKAANLEEHVRWYSSFRTRYHESRSANEPVLALQSRLRALVAAHSNVSVETVSHSSTPQKSLRVHIRSGAPSAPIVVLGGHLDSINGWGWGDPQAPGADDNASGVGALLEAVRILAGASAQLTHDVVVYLYAGEEAGLLGSGEIAQDSKRQKVQVRGVLQLDMTMFPGDGPAVISSMTDFTDPRLRQWLKDFNANVLGAKLIEDECGYGCSDHASWHRQGYATLMPFESSFDAMNKNIHTSRDVVDARSNFDHAALFAKIAVGFALSAPNTNACL